MSDADRVPRRVFLSHTSEFARCLAAGGTFVDAAARAIAMADDVIVEMSLFPASPDIPLEVCRERIAACDLVVLIIGFRHGSPVPGGDGRSYVEWEYDTAGECGLPQLAFLLDERAEGPAELFVDPDGAARQHLFRERLRARGVVPTFVTPDQLENQVFQALTAIETAGSQARRRRPRVQFVDCTNVQKGDHNIMINYSVIP